MARQQRLLWLAVTTDTVNTVNFEVSSSAVQGAGLSGSSKTLLDQINTPCQNMSRNLASTDSLGRRDVVNRQRNLAGRFRLEDSVKKSRTRRCSRIDVDVCAHSRCRSWDGSGLMGSRCTAGGLLHGTALRAGCRVFECLPMAGMWKLVEIDGVAQWMLSTRGHGGLSTRQ